MKNKRRTRERQLGLCLLTAVQSLFFSLSLFRRYAKRFLFACVLSSLRGMRVNSTHFTMLPIYLTISAGLFFFSPILVLRVCVWIQKTIVSFFFLSKFNLFNMLWFFVDVVKRPDFFYCSLCFLLIKSQFFSFSFVCSVFSRFICSHQPNYMYY